MSDAKTYRRYADDCMRFARTMPEYREQLTAMAATWQLLADAAEKKRGDGEAAQESQRQVAKPTQTL
jgi:hypothetical protein